ncbi:sulfotransferase family 2 domain-containing protein [Alkalihalobacterium elongatum]|uniref:sulfotransferase family 2 domain-containing protein n=1 Tax=Alkalihalobacterium elongatum TaxID=2675466 RepID=UPI001C1F20B4|nr:sulfotransferase family 2 domain-containing protein [Alkalihalobacterium elongatum]
MIFNKEKETNSVIIFLHIPKTAGSTFNSLIEKQYENNYTMISPKYGEEKVADYFNAIGPKEKLEVVRGHFPFGVHKYLPQKNFTYITFLRDPIERVISAYYYMKSNPIHPYYYKMNQTSLYEFVSEKAFHWAVYNRQTCLLNGHGWNYDLDVAKENITKYFSVVGITERFNESIKLLNDSLGWNICNISKVNVNPNKPKKSEIANEVREVIKEKNQKDIELYQLATHLLDRKLKN